MDFYSCMVYCYLFSSVAAPLWVDVWLYVLYAKPQCTRWAQDNKVHLIESNGEQSFENTDLF